MSTSSVTICLLALVVSLVVAGELDGTDQIVRVSRHPPHFRTLRTKTPPELIGHFPTSLSPLELNHFTKLNERITLPPFWNTWAPPKLSDFFKKPHHHVTMGPNNKENINYSSSNLKVKPFTIPPGGPLSPYIGKTLHPIDFANLKKIHLTKLPPTSQSATHGTE